MDSTTVNRVIIAGSRHFDDYPLLCRGVAESGFKIDRVVSGKAAGADTLGERWAKEHGVPVDEYPANWKDLGKRAGPARNEQMARNAEALVAFLAPNSRGTANMIRTAMKHGLKVHVVKIPVTED